MYEIPLRPRVVSYELLCEVIERMFVMYVHN